MRVRVRVPNDCRSRRRRRDVAHRRRRLVCVRGAGSRAVERDSKNVRDSFQMKGEGARGRQSKRAECARSIDHSSATSPAQKAGGAKPGDNTAALPGRRQATASISPMQRVMVGAARVRSARAAHLSAHELFVVHARGREIYFASVARRSSVRVEVFCRVPVALTWSVAPRRAIVWGEGSDV